MKKRQKIIHRTFTQKNVHKAVDNVHKSCLEQVFAYIYDVSRTHSYQQIVCY